MSTCKSCGAEILWSVVARSGRRIPLDVAEVQPAPRVTAYNAQTGKCRTLTAEDMRYVADWATHGVTFHRAHWATCPQADRWRVTPEAEPA